ncbi:MAG: DUF1080 domain-containing protein, partial [Kiritimatiellales bacterium]|nr:DUF1080 domain-containing protein [Kiritimatiellales bacterium]
MKHKWICILILAAIANQPIQSWSSPANQSGYFTQNELLARGFVPLFDSTSLSGWNVQPWHEGHWVARDGMIDYDGKLPRKKGQDPSLWTIGDYDDFTLYVEWCLPPKPEMKPQPIVLYNGDFLMQEDNPR